MIIQITNEFTLICLYILFGLIGLCVGSFLNVVIYRMPNKMNLAIPRSHCPKCNYQLKWYDNIPILSYIILKGRCRNCHDRISIRYTLVEGMNMLFWILSILMFKDNLILAIIACIIVSSAICIFFIDLEHMVIFDTFQVIILICGIMMIFVDQTYSYLSHLIGFLSASIVFISLALVMSKVLKREALGGGDIKLAMVTGLFLGWQRFLLMMLIASISGSIVMLITKKRDEESKETPFGPFLTIGLIIAMFFGDIIINWYTNLLF